MVFGRKRRVRATKVTSLEEIDEMAASGRPVLIDFWRTGCQPCRTMDGIIDELADEYGETAHVAKVDVMRVPGAAQRYAIRSTPTFLLLATSDRAKKRSKQQQNAPRVTQRWRASGLVKKDALARLLESNGAAKQG